MGDCRSLQAVRGRAGERRRAYGGSWPSSWRSSAAVDEERRSRSSGSSWASGWRSSAVVQDATPGMFMSPIEMSQFTSSTEAVLRNRTGLAREAGRGERAERQEVGSEYGMVASATELEQLLSMGQSARHRGGRAEREWGYWKF
ncbi:hypothetical protein MAPG_00249 [Magnaporthiopsis poae ATCC 64411]|uniref:Uncharacterized protein n=1 Tax=Magnaporthiopsis poae (strain ATCC 64411 / 73-15) TaxID=644358 RepID=A0A0C4DKH6_MAGP6|nr:hypothetical protein MAPG_00249 [Magnaporthiopsis poae ATCC 64411]